MQAVGRQITTLVRVVFRRVGEPPRERKDSFPTRQICTPYCVLIIGVQNPRHSAWKSETRPKGIKSDFHYSRPAGSWPWEANGNNRVGVPLSKAAWVGPRRGRCGAPRTA